MKCPACGDEHAEETIPGIAYKVVACPTMERDKWLLVRREKDGEPEAIIAPPNLATSLLDSVSEPPLRASFGATAAAADLRVWASEVVRGCPGVTPKVLVQLVLRGVLRGACLVDATMNDARKLEIQKAALLALQEAQR